MSGKPVPTEDGQCPGIGELLSSYIDGEVTPAEKSLVEEHLAHCENCARDMESLRFTSGLLQHMPSMELPRSFTIEPSPRRAMSLFFYMRNATAALAAALLVLFAGSTFLQSAVLMPKTSAPMAATASKADESAANEAGAQVPFGASDSQRGEPQKDAKRAPVPAAAPSTEGATAPASAAPAPGAQAQERALAPAAAPQAPGAIPPASDAASGAPTVAAAPPKAAAPPRAAAPLATPVPAAPGLQSAAPAGPAQPLAPNAEARDSAEKATSQAADEAAKVPVPSALPAPERANQAETQSRAQVEPAPQGRDDSTLAAAARLPWGELEIVVGILLVLCGGGTVVLWVTRRN